MWITKQKIALEACYITTINRQFDEERAYPYAVYNIALG